MHIGHDETWEKEHPSWVEAIYEWAQETAEMNDADIIEVWPWIDTLDIDGLLRDRHNLEHILIDVATDVAKYLTSITLVCLAAKGESIAP